MRNATILVVTLAGALMLETPAAACRYCMQFGRDGVDPYAQAPEPAPPPEGPADITKTPALDDADIGYLTSLEKGIYKQIGNNIADSRIKDMWKRLLPKSTILSLLVPHANLLLADLRAKAKAGKLLPQDLKAAEHHLRDLSAVLEKGDTEFLKSILPPAPASEPAPKS